MVTNHYNFYYMASLHPRLTLHNMTEDKMTGTYFIPFILSFVEETKFRLSISGTALPSKGKAFKWELCGHKGKERCLLFEASSQVMAIRYAILAMDELLFLNFVDTIENRTFVIPFQTHPIRFSSVNHDTYTAQGFVNYRKAVLAYRPKERSPYKIRVASGRGVLLLDCYDTYEAQKKLRHTVK